MSLLCRVDLDFDKLSEYSREWVLCGSPAEQKSRFLRLMAIVAPFDLQTSPKVPLFLEDKQLSLAVLQRIIDQCPHICNASRLFTLLNLMGCSLSRGSVLKYHDVERLNLYYPSVADRPKTSAVKLKFKDTQDMIHHWLESSHFYDDIMTDLHLGVYD